MNAEDQNILEQEGKCLILIQRVSHILDFLFIAERMEKFSFILRPIPLNGVLSMHSVTGCELAPQSHSPLQQICTPKYFN